MKKITLIFIIFVFIFVAPTTSAEYMDSYVLGPGDVIEIRAWSSKDSDILVVNPVSAAPGVQISGTETHSVAVSRDGRIYVPLIGVVKVGGMKVTELENYLKKKLKGFAPDAQVVVLLREPKPVNVYVLGQVMKPGLYSVPDGNPDETRIMNYINLAQGFTRYANKGNVKIIRKSLEKEEVLKVNLQKIELEEDLSQNLALKEGDVVIVSSHANMVYVLGEVLNPGAYEYVDGSKLINYISMAGGPTKRAVNEVGIIRGEEVIKANINEIIGGKNGKEVGIAAGDIIFVPQSFYANWADILGTFKLVRDTLTVPRDTRDAYLDLTGQPRKTYVPTSPGE